MNNKQKFLFNGQIVSLNCQIGETLLEVATRGQIPLYQSCGGMGTCGTCRVVIIEGIENLQPPGPVELEMINDRGFLHYERLACQNIVTEGVVVEIPKSKKNNS